MLEVDVLIAGGGPVGVALAIELGLFGVSCLVVEKHAAPQRLPKAQGISPRSVEFFQRWGLQEQLHKASFLPPAIPSTSIWCSGMTGELYAQIPVGGKSDISYCSPYEYERVALWRTEEVLRNRLKSLPTIQMWLNKTVVAVEQNAKSVVATIKDKDGHTQQVSAKYLVGCDGARSIVREKCKIAVTGNPSISCVRQYLFHSTDLDKITTMPPGILYYIFDNHQFAVIGRVDDKGLWYAHIPIDDVQQEQDIIEHLYERLGVKFQVAVESTALWHLNAVQANQYRKGRVFLCGDAAHTFPPTGGHGLNTGFGDAVNLGWKLAAVIKGFGPEELLATYEAERHPVAQYNAAATYEIAMAHGQLHQQYSPTKDLKAFQDKLIENAKRHSEGLGIAMGYFYAGSLCFPDSFSAKPVMSKEDYVLAAYPGCSAPHAKLKDGKNLFDVLGVGFTLLVFDKSLDTTNLAQDAAHKKVPLTIVYLDDPQVRKLYGADLILIRPDKHIVWRRNDVPAHFEFMQST